MLKILKTILILTITINCLTNISGQELRSLSRNQVIINALSKNEIKTFKVKSESDSLILPFFEDFSDYGPLPLSWPFPKQSKWSDSYAFINSEYADSMISIGVATLDAIDQNGFPYSLDKLKKGYSDTLTSNPFKIYPIHDSIYLSFFYEAGGKGDKPETKDSLLVDFYSPEYDWVKAWWTLGGTQQHNFTQVNIHVPDTLLKNGFRFRFRNHTSIDNANPYKQSNADEWHLDYIRLISTLQPDTLYNLNDAMVIEPLLPSLLEYSSVPYRHLDLARNSSERQHTSMVIRTSYPQKPEPLTITRFHSYFDVDNNTSDGSGGIANTIESTEVHRFDDNFIPAMNYNSSNKSGKLELLSYFNISDTSQITVNDTVRRTEYYSDYYAYDDGSAEFGFGVSGESADLIFIANRYRIYRKSYDPDTLKAVYIYFNKTESDTTKYINFKICVWKNDGDKPGELLYESSEYYSPPSTTYLNDFTRYEIETPVLVSDTIFVGIKQESATFINLGYDINYNSLKNLYVKTSTDWFNPSSINAGSLMIRPSFGTEDQSLMVNKPIINSQIRIFPNPAKDFINIILPDDQRKTPVNVRIVNIMGAIQFNAITDNSSIDVSALQSGVYFMVISSTTGDFNSVVKFLKR